MATYLQQLMRIAYLPKHVIERNVFEPFDSADELKKYIAFMYNRTTEGRQQLYQDRFLIIPLGALNGNEQYCLFESNRNAGRQPWALTFIGTETELCRRVAPFRFDSTLPCYSNALTEYNMGLFAFAYVPIATFSSLDGLYSNSLSVQENVEAQFRECWKTGRIVYSESDGHTNAAFALGINRGQEPLYATFSLNRNQGQQKWYCVGFLTRDRMRGFENIDFENTNPPDETQPPAERPKVFLVYGMDPVSHTPPANLPVIKHLLWAKNIEPIDLASEEHGGQTVIEAFEERAAQCKFAFVIYTPCDEGIDPQWELNAHGARERRQIWYPRQNVVFETGYFMAKLGRDRVRILLQKGDKDLKKPSDIDGVFYINMEDFSWCDRMLEALRREGVIN